MGTVVDVLARELAAALAIGAPTARTIRDHAAKTMIQVGTGSEAMRPYNGPWTTLQPIFWQSAKQARAHVSIVESTAFDISNQKIVDLLNGGIRSGQELKKRLETMQAALTREIADRGDKRISDPGAVASNFMQKMVEIAPDTTDARRFVLQSLALMDIGPDDIGPETTMAEIGDLLVFRKQALVAAQAAGLSEAEARRVQMSVIPSWRIKHALTTHKQDQAERKGSNLIDSHLATLSPYADITFVDKRTMETFRRVFSKSGEMVELVRDVRRTTDYFSVFPSTSPHRQGD
jgi:hypothetical protein